MTWTSPTSWSRWAAVAAAAALVTGMGLGATPAAASPAGGPATPFPVSVGQLRGHLGAAASKLAGPLRNTGGAPQAVFVQLTGGGAAQAAAQAPPMTSAVHAARVRRDQVSQHAGEVLGTAKNADHRAKKIFQVSNAVPGVALNANGKALRAIAARGDVVRVYPLPTDTVSNAGAAQLTRVLRTWRAVGDLGRRVRVGIIDTGVDYTHADFGGPGTPAAYQSALANDTDPNWRARLPRMARAKVVGGYDFVGDDYDASPTDASGNPNPNYQPVPKPDQNPLDCEDHGTHVAGTLAGYGVNADGSTFTGNYRKLTGKRLYSMGIGPGMAPKASIYALKVFGCSGSTNAVIPALDWALDPNGDGNFSDHLDIVNLSLGSDYGTVDDPENLVVNQLAKHGVLPVIAAGNGGDLTDIGGAPGNAVGALDVASSRDAYQLRDGLQVNTPAADHGIVDGQLSINYDWTVHPGPVTGDVVAIPGANADGCDPLSSSDAAKVSGKVAWLEWDDNDATRRCGSTQRANNVRDAGAVGAIFTSTLDVFNAAISGSADIPVFQLPKAQTARLRPALDAGNLNVTFDGRYARSVKSVTPAIDDTISTFSSRGTHGSLGVVKPDVAAPGDTITSAKRGSGSGSATFDGTSMATPHVAGIAALVVAEHPAWSAAKVKAAVMNTAVHDLFTGENHKGRRYAPARDGAGRVDARYAVATPLLAYSTGDPAAVSASFGVVPAAITARHVVRHRRVTVQNTGAHARTVRLRYDAVDTQPGVSYAVSPRTLTVPAHGRRVAKVTMTVTPSALRRRIDPTMAAAQTLAPGLDVPREFVPDASGRLLVEPAHRPALRVPVYGTAKPTSKTTASVRGRSIRLTGKGVDQGLGSAAYRSAVSVMSLGAVSRSLPRCVVGMSQGCVYNASSRAGDLRYVGAGSVPAAGSGPDAAPATTWFGVVTRGDWATTGNSMVTIVDIDTNGDGKPDYETDLQNFPASDVLVAATFDLATGENVDIEPVNFEFGNVDTNVFDTNTVLIPVLTAALGIKPADPGDITYEVSTFDGVQDATLDDSGPVSFNVNDPKVSTEAPLFEDVGRTRIPYSLGGSVGPAGTRALVVHLHGADGHRAQVLHLPATR